MTPIEMNERLISYLNKQYSIEVELVDSSISFHDEVSRWSNNILLVILIKEDSMLRYF